ncbi:MAG: hypothetical protein WAQ28_17165 [Bacteroidia bacterium]
MKKTKQTGLDFEIDKLTNSIENVVTGDSFSTDITLISVTNLKTAIKKNGWQFDWNKNSNSLQETFINLQS